MYSNDDDARPVSVSEDYAQPDMDELLATALRLAPNERVKAKLAIKTLVNVGWPIVKATKEILGGYHRARYDRLRWRR